VPFDEDFADAVQGPVDLFARDLDVEHPNALGALDDYGCGRQAGTVAQAFGGEFWSGKVTSDLPRMLSMSVTIS